MLFTTMVVTHSTDLLEGQPGCYWVQMSVLQPAANILPIGFDLSCLVYILWQVGLFKVRADRIP